MKPHARTGAGVSPVGLNQLIFTQVATHVGRKPRTPEHLRTLYRLMWIAWGTHSLCFPVVTVVNGLRLDTVTSVGEFALGCDGWYLVAASGNTPSWGDVLATEYEHRKSWCDM